MPWWFNIVIATTNLLYISADRLDGSLARHHGTGSSLGAFFDETSDGFGFTSCWMMLTLYVFSTSSTSFAVAYQLAMMSMIYIPIVVHYATHTVGRVNAGNIGMIEVYFIFILISLAAAIWGNHIYNYNLLHFLPFIPPQWGLTFTIPYLFLFLIIES